MNLIKKLFRKPSIKREIDEELRFHIEQRTAQNLASGMTTEEAEREARRRFGNLQNVREDCRELRGVNFGETIFREIRLGLRMLGKNPGFAAIAILSLALGIGLNTSMFKVINTLLLQPLDFPEARNLYCVQRTTPQQQIDHHSPVGFYEIAEQSSDFAQIAAVRGWGFTLSESNRPAEMVDAERVSTGLFDILKIQPELGRGFLPEEDQPGRNQVILISHTFWLSRYGGDSHVIGQMVRLDGAPAEIIGVLPARLDSSQVFRGMQVYRPLGLTGEEKADPKDANYMIVGRYRPGFSADQTRARFTALAARLAADHPEQNGGSGLRVVSLQSVESNGSVRPITIMLLALSGFVLLIACANLGNLLLARTVARSSEFAIRIAIGASKTQLIRPMLVECALLAVVGGFLGVLVSIWTNDWMARQLGGDNPIRFAIDWRVLVFTATASLLAALICCIGPGWLISRTRVNESLKGGRRGLAGDRSHHRFRHSLVVGQFTMALVLLTGAAFFLRGVDRLVHRQAGWNPSPLLCGMVALPVGAYPDGSAKTAFYKTLEQRLAALPGVESVAISYDYPMTPFPGLRKYVVEGAPLPEPGHEPTAFVNGISEHYFETVGTRLLHGRAFSSVDRDNSQPVVIINEDMARALFPGRDAIGHRLAIAGEKEPRWLEIVGVAENIRFLSVSPSQIDFQLYQPLVQETWNYVALNVRTAGSAATLIEPVRRAVTDMDPDIPVMRLAPAPVQIQNNTSDLKMTQELLVGFALLGLFLAALGIYGVIAHIVAQRTAEIGIRMALGAQMGHVVRLILSAGMRMALLGAGLGLLGAAALARFLTATMPGLATGNTVAVVGATVLLVVIALLACLLPARRAAKIDPMTALRHE
jgi:putative ABC transport system permease protein